MVEPEATLSSRFTRFVFLALIASLGFIQIPVFVFGQPVVISDIVFLLLVVSWLSDIVRGFRPPRWHSFYWLLILYVFALILSSTFSADPLRSFSRLPAEVYLPVLAALVADVVRTPAGLRSSILSWLLGTAFAVVLGILTIVLFYVSPTSPLLEYVTYHYGAVPVGDYPRITSTFVSASMFCNYLNVSLLITILAAASAWISVRLAWVLGALIVICSGFTISAGLGGLFLGLGVAYFLYRTSTTRLRWPVLTAAVLAALTFLFLSAVSLIPDRGEESRFAGIAFSPSGRISIWHDAWQTFMTNIVTGHGIGLPVANVIFRNAEGTYSVLSDAHNTYLDLAAHTGLIGLAAIIAIAVYILRRWKNVIRNRQGEVILWLGTAFLCAFVYQGLTGSFEHARHLWVLIGLFVAAERNGSTPVQNS